MTMKMIIMIEREKKKRVGEKREEGRTGETV